MSFFTNLDQNWLFIYLLLKSYSVHMTKKKKDIKNYDKSKTHTHRLSTSCVGGRHNILPPHAGWPLTVVSESRVTWATSVPILVFLGLSILDLGPIYATDVRRASSLNAPAMGAGA